MFFRSDLVTRNTYQLSITFLISTFFLFFTNLASANEPAPVAPTYLIIPKITLNSIILPVGWKKITVDGQTYGQWLADDNLVGWHNLSASPGQIGNTVLNGHSNAYGKVFQNLHYIEIGDEIIVFSGDQPYHYHVTQKFLVQEKGVSTEERIENAKLIMPTEDERLTLVTCSYPGATHRLIVVAHPVAQ